jgi:hypothetical protein
MQWCRVKDALDGNLIVMYSVGIQPNTGPAGRTAIQDGLPSLTDHGYGGFPDFWTSHCLNGNVDTPSTLCQRPYCCHLIWHVSVIHDRIDPKLLGETEALRGATA